jgi:hypothetical protein
MEDHRRDDNGSVAKRVIGLAMSHPVSRQWKGFGNATMIGSTSFRIDDVCLY